MKVKIFLFIIGVLALTQMLLYSRMVDDNEAKWKAALKDVDAQITNHKNDILSTQLLVRSMEKKMKTIPTAISEGVADPEKKFLQFMDYLDNSELGSMKGSYEISAKPIIKYKPVPLQQTDFAIQFQFVNAQKLESVLGYFLDQQRDYPLKVNRLEIMRVPGNIPKVNLDVSLLLPAKILGSEVNPNKGSKSIGG